jgi:hypothetical protein
LNRRLSESEDKKEEAVMSLKQFSSSDVAESIQKSSSSSRTTKSSSMSAKETRYSRRSESNIRRERSNSGSSTINSAVLVNDGSLHTVATMDVVEVETKAPIDATFDPEVQGILKASSTKPR